MSAHSVPVLEIEEIEPHPNADRLEKARVRGYRIVVGKGEFRAGDWIAYIPDGSVLPEPLLEEMNLAGKLAGSKKNRVKPIRLRGELSEGLCYPVPEDRTLRGRPVALGDDVADLLGVEKYVPEVPASMSGEVRPAASLAFDVENLKAFPDVFEPGEAVEATEKLHGTFCGLGMTEEGPVAFSKGIGENRTGFVLDAEANRDNVYVQVFRRYEAALREVWEAVRSRPGEPVYVCGEIVGPKVQDLRYGLKEREFYAFDVYAGERGRGRYLSPPEFRAAVEGRFPVVPLVAAGAWGEPPWTGEGAVALTEGPSLLAERNGLEQVREGVVLRAATERPTPAGRSVLKVVNPAYLTRRKGTEYQ